MDFTGVTASNNNQEDRAMECPSTSSYLPIQERPVSLGMPATRESDAHAGDMLGLGPMGGSGGGPCVQDQSNSLRHVSNMSTGILARA
jgi:hypothetical protein